MPLDPNLWNSPQKNWTLPGVTDDEFAKLEKSLKIKLPALMKDMYRIQNGGMVRDETDMFFAPIGKSLQWIEPMSSLLQLIQQDRFLNADDLEFVEEEFGSAKKILCFASAYGHVMYALNYNDKNSKGEPSVLSLANDGGGDFVDAESFAAWIGARFGTETELALDWAEHEQYPVLFQSTSIWSTKQGHPAEKESVLCRNGKQGLMLFERVQQKGRTQEVNRAALPNGVDQTWLKVEKFGGAGPWSYLHLQPVEQDDIEWVMCELRSNGEWKTERSKRVPIYAMVLSKDQQGLRELARTLEKLGLVHERPPVEIPPEFQGAMDGLMKFGQFMMGRMQQRRSDEEELPTEAPAIDGQPAQMSRQDILEKLSMIVR